MRLSVKEKKVVFDTNILISSFVFPDGIVREIMNLAIFKKIKIYTSHSILLEYCDVLKKKFKWTDDEIKENIRILSKILQIIEVDLNINAVSEDNTDNKIIECAVKVDADFIISGDKHLLKLKIFKNILIIKPAEFLKRIS